MNKIIFSKYSNERSDRFCIRTDICRDGEGNRWVEKCPMHPQAKQHVADIAAAYEQLSAFWRGSGLEMNQCEWDEKKQILRFSYLNGQTLEEELDELLAEQGAKSVCDRIRSYLSILIEKTGTIPFDRSDAFAAVFGQADGLAGMKAFPVSDIDMIFSNVMTGAQGDTVIDYEWTFPFPVPVNYVIYRCLYYYIRGNAKRLALEDENLYEAYGISGEQKKIFAGMEDAFQSYILGERTPIRLLYDIISPGYTDMKPVLDQIFQENDKRKVQVFYDYGSGYQEKDSACYPAGQGLVKLNVPVPEGIRAMRIDPCSHACVLWVKKLRAGKKEMDFSSNGICTGKDLYLFETEDPQLIIEEISGERTQVEFEFQVSFLEGLALESVKSMKNQLEISRERVRQMEGTRIWKLNEKIRKLKHV